MHVREPWLERSADSVGGAKRDDDAFWCWAVVETLRHTGVRVEELQELSHHATRRPVGRPGVRPSKNAIMAVP
jgi:hypothetical protein